MPTILITGVTGFIGAHVADQFLKAGFTVVGTTRKATKADDLKKYFSVYGDDKFHVIEVPDLQAKGALDDAVKDVDVVAHVASPVILDDSADPIVDIVNPAIHGTLNVLMSAHQFGKHVKSVVVTSSIASVMNRNAAPGSKFTEIDWNDGAIKLVRKSIEQNVTPPVGLPYVASKNEAERALWRFKEEHKPSFTLTTILPAFVLGSLIPPPVSAKDVSKASTAASVVNFYTGASRDPQKPPFVPFFVNVVDVGRAHVLAVEKSNVADGQRYIVSASSFDNQRVVDVLLQAYPHQKDVIDHGVPGQYITPSFEFDGSKIVRELGLVYTSFEQSVRDSVEPFAKL